ncbi:MAG: PD40 domain-containing protein, partial [Flavobacteriales bacterium]|nr:PD40 domain-containing protein [Flavobacteriales bacterium]
MGFRIVFLLSICFILSIADTKGQRDQEFSTDYVMGGGEEALLEDAEWIFGIGDYKRALPLFVKLNSRYPGTNAYKYYAGICYLKKTDEQEKAISYLEGAYSRDPRLPDILFYLGRAYMVTYQFDEAIGYYKLALDNKKTSTVYKEEIPRLIEQCGNAKVLASKNIEEKLVLENIGPPVNTEYDEYVPLVSHDESVMIYTYKGKRSRGGLINIYGEADPDGMFYEDIFGAYRLGNKWLDPDGLGSRINSNYHDASIALAPDGRSMFIYKDQRGGDIYISRLIKNTWITPTPIMGEVNTKSYEGHASITVDERVMFFVSDRPGGFGGMDIYQATRQDDETWGNITNLGPTINTPYDEDAPFIHSNNILLYFSSKGHNSMGGYDIFFSTYENKAWTAPHNIGPPVNTPNDDNFYVVSANGERAYFSSARAGGYGGQDIYVVRPGVFGKKPVLALIKGIVENNGRALEATIQVTNTTTNEAYGKYKSNAATGNYLIALPPGYDYKLDFILKDKVLHSENVDVTGLGVFVEVAQNFELASKKNPFIDSTNILQGLLSEKIAEIEIAKAELALESELQDTILDTTPEEIAKLYLLDASGDVIMTSLKDTLGQFNFTGEVMKDEYSMLFDSKMSDIDEEIIVLITDADGNEKLIATTVVVATASQVALLEGSKVLVLQETKDEATILTAEEEARLAALEAARLQAEADSIALLDEDARLKAEEEARLKAEVDASRTAADAEAAVKVQAELEARMLAEAADKAKAEEEARLAALEA